MAKEYKIRVAAEKRSLEELRNDISTALEGSLSPSNKKKIRANLGEAFGLAEDQANLLRGLLQDMPTDTSGIEKMKKELQGTLKFVSEVMDKMQELGDSTEWMKNGTGFVDKFIEMESSLQKIDGIEKSMDRISKSFKGLKEAFKTLNYDAYIKRFANIPKSALDEVKKAEELIDRAYKSRNAGAKQSTQIDFGFDEYASSMSPEDIKTKYYEIIEIIKNGNQQIDALTQKYKGKKAQLYADEDYQDAISDISLATKNLKNLQKLSNFDSAFSDTGTQFSAQIRAATDEITSATKEASKSLKQVINDLKNQGIDIQINLPEADSAAFTSKINEFVNKATEQFAKNPVKINVDLTNPFKDAKKIKKDTKKDIQNSEALELFERHAKAQNIDTESDEFKNLGLDTKDTSDIVRNLMNSFNKIYNTMTAGQSTISKAAQKWRDEMQKYLTLKATFNEQDIKSETTDMMVALQEYLDNEVALHLAPDTDGLIDEIQKALKEAKFNIDVNTGNIEGVTASNVNLDVSKLLGILSGVQFVPTQGASQPVQPRITSPVAATPVVAEQTEAVKEGTHTQRVLTDAIENLNAVINRNNYLDETIKPTITESTVSGIQKAREEASARGVAITSRKKEIEKLIATTKDTTLLEKLRAEFRQLEEEWDALYQEIQRLDQRKKDVESRLEKIDSGEYVDPAIKNAENRKKQNKLSEQYIEEIQSVLNGSENPIKLIVKPLEAFLKKSNNVISTANDKLQQYDEELKGLKETDEKYSEILANKKKTEEQIALWSNRKTILEQKGLLTTNDDGEHIINLSELTEVLRTSSTLASDIHGSDYFKTKVKSISDLEYFIPLVQDAMGFKTQSVEEFANEEKLREKFIEIFKLNEMLTKIYNMFPNKGKLPKLEDVDAFIDFFEKVDKPIAESIQSAKKRLEVLNKELEGLDPESSEYKSKKAEIVRTEEKANKTDFVRNMIESAKEYRQSFTGLGEITDPTKLNEILTEMPNVASNLWDSMNKTVKKRMTDALFSLEGFSEYQEITSKDIPKLFDKIQEAYSSGAFTSISSKDKNFKSLMNLLQGATDVSNKRKVLDSALKTGQATYRSQIGSVLHKIIGDEPLSIKAPNRWGKEKVYSIHNKGTAGTYADESFSLSPGDLNRFLKQMGLQEKMSEIIVAVFDNPMLAQTLINSLFEEGKIQLAGKKDAFVPKHAEKQTFSDSVVAQNLKDQANKQKEIEKLETGEYKDKKYITDRLAELATDDEKKKFLDGIIEARRKELASLQEVEKNEITTQQKLQALLALDEDIKIQQAKVTDANADSKSRNRFANSILRDGTKSGVYQRRKNQEKSNLYRASDQFQINVGRTGHNREESLQALLNRIQVANEFNLMDTKELNTLVEDYQNKTKEAYKITDLKHAGKASKEEMDKAWEEARAARKTLIDTYYETSGWLVTTVAQNALETNENELERTKKDIKSLKDKMSELNEEKKQQDKLGVTAKEKEKLETKYKELEKQLSEKEAQKAELENKEKIIKRFRGKTDVGLLAEQQKTSGKNDKKEATDESKVLTELKAQKKALMTKYNITEEMLEAERKQTAIYQESAKENKEVVEAVEESNVAATRTNAARTSSGAFVGVPAGVVGAFDTSDLAKEGTLRGIYELLNGGAPKGGWDDSISESTKTHENVGNSADFASGVNKELNLAVKSFSSKLSNVASGVSKVVKDIGTMPYENMAFLDDSKQVGRYIKGDENGVDGSKIKNFLNRHKKDNLQLALHNHPDGMSALSPQDIVSAIALATNGVGGFGSIANGKITGIDLSGVSQEVGLQLRNKYAELIRGAEFSDLFDENFEIYPEFADQINKSVLSDKLNELLRKAIDSVNLDSNEIFGQIDVSQLDDAAKKVAETVVEAGVQVAVEKSKQQGGNIGKSKTYQLMEERIARANALSKAGIKVDREHLLPNTDEAFKAGLNGGSIKEVRELERDKLNQSVMSIIGFCRTLDDIAKNASGENWESLSGKTMGAGWYHFSTKEHNKTDSAFTKKAYGTFTDAGELSKKLFEEMLNELTSRGFTGNVKIPDTDSGFLYTDQFVAHADNDKSFKVLIQWMEEQAAKGIFEKISAGVDISKFPTGDQKASWSNLLADIYAAAPGETFTVQEIEEIFKGLVNPDKGHSWAFSSAHQKEFYDEIIAPVIAKRANKAPDVNVDDSKLDTTIQKVADTVVEAGTEAVVETTKKTTKKKKSNKKSKTTKTQRASTSTKTQSEAQQQESTSIVQPTTSSRNNIIVPESGNNQGGILGLLGALAKDETLNSILAILNSGVKVNKGEGGTKKSGGKKSGSTDDDSQKNWMPKEKAEAELRAYLNEHYKGAGYVAGAVRDTPVGYSINASRQRDNAAAIQEAEKAIAQCEIGTDAWFEATKRLAMLQQEQEDIVVRINAENGKITASTSFKNLAVGAKAATKELQNVEDVMYQLHSAGALSFDANGTAMSSNESVKNFLSSVGALNAFTAGKTQDELFDPANSATLSNLALAVQKYRKEVIALIGAVDQYNNGDEIGKLTGSLAELDDSHIKQSMQDIVAQSTDLETTFGKLTPVIKNGQVVSYQLAYTLKTGKREVQQMTASLNPLTGELRAQKGEVQSVATGWDRFLSGLKGKMASIMQYLISITSIHDMIRYMRQGVEYVRQIDLALTELKKVTDETDASYNRFLQTASKTGAKIGATVADFVNATADFARLGYNIEQAASLAEAASVYKNVGDGIDDIATATESIISTMKAFGIEADNAMGIVDRFNEVGNNFAISSTGIGEAMQRSASALFEAGNTIDESIALITGANSVIQNPEQVGTALKTLALRLRGAKVELEEAGEDVDGMAESTSQLQTKLKALTHGKVDIMLNADTFKNTTQILREMSGAWEDMTDIERASALELMGGKRQANILASVIKNFDTVENVIETSMGASGSALAENEKVLDSIQGKVTLFTNSLQTMWMNFINSDTVKDIVDLGTAAIKLVDALGLLPTVLGGFSAFKIATKDAKANLDAVNKSIQESIAAKQAQAVASQANAAAQATENAQEDAGVVSKNAGIAASWKDVIATNAQTAASKALAIAKGLLTGIAKGVVVMLAAQVVGSAFNAIYESIDKTVNRAKYLKKEVEELKTTYEDAKKTFSENLTELTTSSDTKVYATLQDEFEALTNGVDKYGNNLSLTSDQYERYKDICEKIVGINPEIAKGYDSATRAIGNNASALSQLIELQKIQQRQNVRDFIKDENLDKIAEYAYNDINSASTSLEYTKSMGATNRQQSVKIAEQLKQNMIRTAANGDTNTIAVDDYDIFALFGMQDYWDDYTYSSNKAADLINDHFNEIQQALNNANNGIEHLYADGLNGSISISSDNVATLNKLINDYATDYSNAIKGAESQLEKAKNGLIDTLLQVPFATDSYDSLGDKSKNIITEWIKNTEAFKVDPNATEEEMQHQLKDNVALIEKLVTQFADENIQSIVNQLDDIDLNLSAVDYEDKVLDVYKQLYEAIGGDNNEYGFKSFDHFSKNFFGFNPSEELKAFDQGIKTIEGYFKTHSVNVDVSSIFNYKTMSRAEMDAFLGIDWNKIGAENVKSAIDVWNLIHNAIGRSNINSVKTYSVLTDEFEKYNDILKQTSELVVDNTEVSQEYKDSLLQLGVSSEDLEKCFDSNNKLLVTNAKELNRVVKSANKNTVQNTKLAKSQAKLQYYELYKKMRSYINAEGKVIAGKQVEILALYQEMNALEQTISKYSRLETQLLGAANAYEKFEQAQEIDSETDYMSNAEDMLSALGKAFSTGELGTESARAAIEGLVPESVYEDLDTVDEKMEAINKYFKEGKLAQYFSLEFDDDGALTGAEMKLGNLRKFIEDGLAGVEGTKVFEGTDWRHFEFSESFLDGLSEADDKLQYFADSMGVTKEVAFAFIESINDHDIEWLNGDYSSLFDILTPETLENSIYSTIQSTSDLNAQLANGKISSEEYNKSMFGLKGQLDAGVISEDEYNASLTNLNEQLNKGTITTQAYNKALYGLSGQEEILAEQAKTDALLWYEKTDKLDEYKSQIQEYYKQLESGKDAEGNLINAEDVRDRIDTIMGNINTLTKELAELEEPTKVTLQLAYDDIQKDLDNIEKEIGDVIEGTHYQFNVDAAKYEVILDENDPNYQKVSQFVSLLNSQHTINTQMGEETPNVLNTLQSINDTLEKIQKLFETKYNLQVNIDGAVTQTRTFKDLWDGIKDKSVTLWSTVKEKVVQYFSRTPKEGDGEVNGTANVSGSAHASGNWGLQKSENDSLVGELGPEMVVDPRSGRYYTVGDNGAEMVDLPKGAIIFNHKQTEGLLQNGHITSRGKAYASGNAHVTIWPNESSKDQWKGTGYSSWDDPTYDLKEALDDAAGSVNDFEETIDWISMRMEELDEALSLYQTRLENQSTYAEKNNIIDQMIEINKDIWSNASAGAKYYADYAEKYLVGMSKELADAARNGAISITEFTKEQDEATVKAIQNYRDYAGKAASLQEQAEATIASIRDLAIEKIDNIQSYGSAKTSIEDLQTEKLQNIIDYYETKGEIPSSAYYGVNGGDAASSTGMFENSYKKIDYWTPLLADMQTKFNEAVQKGQIEVGSIEWYEQLEKLYQVQAEINAATIEIEEFQNAINDIYWENFDELINRLDYVQNETQNLIDLMDQDDMIVEPEKRKYENGTVEFWTADQVKWTDEGLASLGLYAQQMEIAEYTAKKYGEEIAKLESNKEQLIADGIYSENEYIEKLEELKSAQYDEIEAYYDAQDAIKDLNKQRIDAVKDGIQKEIDAYEELIDKKKEELDAEKDLYDWQKQIEDSSKNIAEIERKLAALAYDNSASARAQRAKLEAELAEARAEQEDMYYNRSIENQQNALDKELESFKEEKDAEIEALDKYLEDVEVIVADSLAIVQENAVAIGNTLTEKANEYNLSVSDAILTPWSDGSIAISDYQDTFGTATSSTMDQLDLLKDKWQEVIDKMAEVGDATVKAINAENAGYAAATKKEPVTGTQTSNDSTTTTTTDTSKDKVSYSTYTVQSGDSLSAIAKSKLGSASKWQEIYELNKDILSNPNLIYPGQKLKIPQYAKGTVSLNKSGIVNVDELGEELILRAQNGRLTYMEKGSGVVPADLTSNLMKWGELDPSDMLDRSRPAINAPHIVNNEININMNIAEVVHIDEVTNDTIPDLTKAVQKQMDAYMLKVNNAIKAKVR